MEKKARVIEFRTGEGKVIFSLYVFEKRLLPRINKKGNQIPHLQRNQNLKVREPRVVVSEEMRIL